MKTKVKVKVDSIISISINTVNPLFTSMDIIGWSRPSARKWDKFFAFRLGIVKNFCRLFVRNIYTSPSTKRNINSITTNIYCQNG